MKNFTFLSSRLSFSLFLLFCLLVQPLFAQEEEKQEEDLPVHEIRLDIFQLIVLPGVDVSYEHFIDEVSSWGVSGFINFNLEEDYRYETFEISPYYRLYFSQKKHHNTGFFVQPFLSFTKGVYDYYNYLYQASTSSYDYSYFTEKDFIGLSGGALIGYKWVNQKNYSFEIHGGVGRYFITNIKEKNEYNYTSGTAYPRINFSVGKRF